MSPEQEKHKPAPPPQPDIQEGGERSPAKDDALKRVIKQHPQRDEPRVDSVEVQEKPRP